MAKTQLNNSFNQFLRSYILKDFKEINNKKN